MQSKETYYFIGKALVKLIMGHKAHEMNIVQTPVSESETF
ncbi:hypothetical protein THF1C08_600001 [Vibrio jasicida]|uniref:Uncharacterized protein n=1 Tax=Vibrio jasicida TaxID=766224 RepID=A0AAU9QUK3_9VIBR|nr:hypothetical protein THF1C08_600001 [Vibrio jasicida]CAH1602480.1 hypothetical protein THF1A12_590006 [Vibrio jasicida]